uniref:At1g61320/AtMIF1 LRR domain-containing protein n=1 Tax=Oryza punctata TaxID=4537 RepID=A0A0E0KKS4_ORYPU
MPWQLDHNPTARPKDLVIYEILSKLPLNEAAKTSVLSSKWRCIWLKCPRLRFDGLAIFDLDRIPAHYLDNWVISSLSSKTKNLSLDLRTNYIEQYPAHYKFPSELLDSRSLSGLQHVQLSFVSIKPPSKFRGFPNLRKLDLQFLDVTSKDLEIMLSSCIILEWLNIDGCHLNDELRVGSPLPRLVYLQVAYCDVTKIQFHAVELATFVYKGDFVPIALKHSLKLENANIRLDSLNDRHAISDLVKAFPNLRNLNFHLSWNDIKTELLSDTPWKFSHLRYLQLKNFADSGVLETKFLVSFLRAAPFIEKLEINFWMNLLLLDESQEDHSIRQQFGRCEYSNLKNMHITGYKGSREQFEFLIHVVENAPALEVLTLEGAGIEYQEVAFLMNSAWIDRITLSAKKSALIAQQYLSEKLSSKTKLCIKTT